jgi:four helix bundle protein
MARLAYVRSYKDLIVYRKSRALATDIFHLTKTFPREERFALTDQVRRSSRAIGAQIAEAWGKRRYEKHFISKLTDADGEQMETQHWLGVAYDCGYIDKDTERSLISRCEEIGRMLGSMIAKASVFCNPEALSSFREPGPVYQATSDMAEFFISSPDAPPETEY